MAKIEGRMMRQRLIINSINYFTPQELLFFIRLTSSRPLSFPVSRVIREKYL